MHVKSKQILGSLEKLKKKKIKRICQIQFEIIICEIMDDLTLFIAIFASLAVILFSLLFLKSKQSQQSSETKTGGRRRVAAVPNRDEDGQIVDVGPRGIFSSIL